MKTALQFSMNVPTIRLAQKVGISAVAKTAAAFHFHESLPRVLSAALGSVETTPMREIGAYAGIAAGGKEVIPTLIDSVQDRNGNVIWRPDPALSCTGCDDPANQPELADARKQLGEYGAKIVIHTIRGVGYLMAGEK